MVSPFGLTHRRIQKESPLFLWQTLGSNPCFKIEVTWLILISPFCVCSCLKTDGEPSKEPDSSICDSAVKTCFIYEETKGMTVWIVNFSMLHSKLFLSRGENHWRHSFSNGLLWVTSWQNNFCKTHIDSYISVVPYLLCKSRKRLNKTFLIQILIK